MNLKIDWHEKQLDTWEREIQEMIDERRSLERRIENKRAEILTYRMQISEAKRNGVKAFNRSTFMILEEEC